MAKNRYEKAIREACTDPIVHAANCTIRVITGECLCNAEAIRRNDVRILIKRAMEPIHQRSCGGFGGGPCTCIPDESPPLSLDIPGLVAKIGVDQREEMTELK